MSAQKVQKVSALLDLLGCVPLLLDTNTLLPNSIVADIKSSIGFKAHVAGSTSA